MRAPTLKGIHHLKIPVTDITISLAWYQKVLGAEHLERFDHHDAAGVRYGVILRVPGLGTALELRLAPHAVAAMRGYDPVSFTAGTDRDLRNWLRHLDHHGVPHSPVIRAMGGRLIVFADPDGTYLRLLTMPSGGLESIQMDDRAEEPTGPWLTPHVMRRS